MVAALSLAARGLGQVWPNPAVGCVLVRDGVVVGRGWTQAGGRPHAETEALRRAGPAARGSIAYVTLEPCSHHGRTPPCAEALIAAGVAEVHVALTDPDPRVSGRGIAMLKAAGIAVHHGLCEGEAETLNAGFLSRVVRGRPSVLLKLATSLDARIALRSGESKWITGPEARAAGHRMRAEHDAILVGVGTVLADDPDLTCRVPGLEDRSPIRIVADGRLRTPLTSKLVATARQVPTWIVTSPGNPKERLAALSDLGVELIEVAIGANGHPDCAIMLQALATRGLTRVMVEGGARLASSLLAADLVDRLAWFRAPIAIGHDGRPAVEALGLGRLDAAPSFRRTAIRTMGQDVLETLARRT
ncbi:bifunctional diaminohydroxyphosphoribosylaminopyrimidine deaminase/5-amino-6-(5-phosphoribosylamino)uracil reductase RibD [Zavarzinia sp. CC-PAN008]|uniref:bifunctional diaminohydroxyphosphoribosylaminopyrimidine deaminase/5-amino-6-(5-phosphoribosylamino)uracil reductase RibD n=1 Tax=Zavarzinia sp. CC-PAN008 TaxID=3243332 RepID=UPI003F746152